METIIFMFCLTLHNAEEALWLTEWRIKTRPNDHRTPNKKHFIFAVLGVTVLGYLAAGLFAIWPDNQYFEYAFIGFVGAMLINAVIPHLLLTVRFKKYCPGVFTGCFLIIPFHIVFIYNAANNHLKLSEIIVATLIVGVILLAAIQLFQIIAKKFL